LIHQFRCRATATPALYSLQATLILAYPFSPTLNYQAYSLPCLNNHNNNNNTTTAVTTTTKTTTKRAAPHKTSPTMIS
ncbi:MAG TPA: hypothetical protein VGO47_00475, partial [Chlamydiales bacterium]|nr:hypothetical protein [Chlamydiales bacterium]